MWLYDLLLITDGRIPVKIRFSNGVETEIDSDNWFNENRSCIEIITILIKV